MRAIIIGGGTAPSKNLLESYLREDYFIIAADGGANVLNEYGIIPKYLMGDFDSIDENTYAKLECNSEVTRFPREKDYTDSHIAYKKAIELGADEIILLGCTGKRIDHFMANLGILYDGLKNNIKVIMADDYNEMFLIDKGIHLKGYAGQVFSVFSYGEDTKDLTLTGVKYPLTNYYLSTTDNLTVSNEIIEKEANISFSKGCLLVITNN